MIALFIDRPLGGTMTKLQVQVERFINGRVSIKQILFLAGVLSLSPIFNNCARDYGVTGVSPDPLASTTQSDPTGAGFINSGDGNGNGIPDDLETTVQVNKTSKIHINQSTNNVDILVVIDNSGSMGPEQHNMSSRFDSFISELSTLNWQLGITTTDVSTDKNGVFNAPNRDGRLLDFGNQIFVLDSNMPIADAQLAFNRTIQRPEGEGDGNEQGLGGAYRALQRAQSGQGPTNNSQLIRDDAALAVIVVTDSDENEKNDPRVMVPTTDYMMDFVRKNWPNKPFNFHSIVVLPNDEKCLIQSDPLLDKNNRQMYDKKGNAIFRGNEHYGTRYFDLTKRTNGITGSVCLQDYGTQLADIGKKVRDLVRSVTLDCNPIDTNGDGVPDVTLVSSDPSVSMSTAFLVNNQIVFTTPLPPGDYSFTYRCNMIVSK